MHPPNKGRFLTLVVASSLLATTTAAQARPRPFPPRAARSWEQVVAERQAAYAADPSRFAPPRLEAFPTPVIAANEADPIEGLILNWWCNPFGPDEADLMWMFAIATAVQVGAEPHVYLDTWEDFDGDLVGACSTMLQAVTGIPPALVNWYSGVPSDSFWVRDYGPFFVRDVEHADLSLEDAWYYPIRPNDDAMPQDFAMRIGASASDFDLYFEGGNFLPNGGGLCLVSSIVEDANPHVDRATLDQMFDDELGCEQLVVVDALRDSATGHVDMWMSWADHFTLLVGEYQVEQDPVNRAIIERNVRLKLSDLHDPATGTPIEIVRVPMPSNCPVQPPPGHVPGLDPPMFAPQSCPHVPPSERIWRSYLNVLMLNGVLLLPIYQQDPTYEAEAIATWASHGFSVIPLPADLIAPYEGEFHCVAKTIDAAP